jgi:hypothetical protein
MVSWTFEEMIISFVMRELPDRTAGRRDGQGRDSVLLLLPVLPFQP